jgi:HAD superfamily hydrolase (TIGR01484 family)
MPLPIQLISTDFDGTLHADFENPPVPLRLERQLAALQQQGARWMINTGRDLSSLLESLARARLSIWPDYLGLVEREIYVREGQEYHPLAEWNNACTSDHVTLFARMRPDVARLTAWIEARYKATIYEDPFSPLCMIASSNEVADQIMVYLEDYCSGMENLTVVRNDIYARFSHTKYNKGTVVQEVARRLGIAKEAIFAAGDHLNDIPMLDGVHAGMVAAPGNAIPEVKALIKKVGGYQSDEPWGHGIASALEHFGGAGLQFPTVVR